MPRHLHLDPIGGIAGDMFAAALLDAFPEFEAPALAIARDLVGAEATISVDRAPVAGFAGTRMIVSTDAGYGHRRLSDIRRMLRNCGLLSDGGRDIAMAIFTLLAEAEAAVHGCDVEAVHFHEVGAVDSVADIALAGFLIDAVGATSWSVGSLPMGGGTVRTAHGILPVPAPACARLLEGFEMIDDGISGERVTPTGAAILRYLRPWMVSRRPSFRLSASGNGFGTRRLPDRPNALRVLVLDGAAETAGEIALTSFEIDDQSGEDLAIGLGVVRELPGVLDVIQSPAYGKKGRMVVQVQVIAVPSVQEAVRATIFDQTATLGLREQFVTRHVLSRDAEMRDGLRVKTAQRGCHVTRKVEGDDLERLGIGFAQRKTLRARAECDD